MLLYSQSTLAITEALGTPGELLCKLISTEKRYLKTQWKDISHIRRVIAFESKFSRETRPNMGHVILMWAHRTPGSRKKSKTNVKGTSPKYRKLQ